MNTNGEETADASYTDVLIKGSGAKWKQLLDVQRPYRWNLRRLDLGRTLDVGCGIGRNLGNLSPDSVGVDHNEHSIALARASGFNAMTSEEFIKHHSVKKDEFDSMLLAHVLEHLSTENGEKIIKEYLPFVKDKVAVICPQEKGFKSDETHINFLRHKDIEEILKRCGMKIVRSYSFPFHRQAGKLFTYNETVVVGSQLAD